jgi:hypothetical protein
VAHGAWIIGRNWNWSFLATCAALAARLLRREEDGLARNLLFPVLGVTGVASFLLQAQGLGYTLAPIWAATVPILCSGLALLPVESRRWPRLAAALSAVLLLLPVAGAAKKWSGQLGSSFAWLSGRISRDAHYAHWDAGDGLTAADVLALGAELERAVPPDGTVLVWGRANGVSFMARRAQPTRFHHNVTITRAYLPQPLASRWNDRFRSELEAKAPAYCLVNLGELTFPPPQPESATFLAQYLASEYELVRKVGDDALYRRRGAR